MVEQPTERRLAAILAADVVGYSRLLGADEAATLARLRTLKREVIEPLVAEHNGRIFKTTGDGLLAEFPSAVQALHCAMTIQDRLRADTSSLQLRIGLHQGDVVIDGDDLLGDGVNIAARIEPLAEPGGIAISARVREDAAGKLALDIEDLGEPELKNIAQKIRIYRVRPAAPERPALALPDKPSLAVLPFQNMSGDPEQEYFADGMVEDITTALSRVAGLFVIARNSSFTYKGRAVDVRQVGRELGVRYVLEGSVRRAGGRLRITCQLINASTGAHLWADRFDADLADIFDLQDRVAESVAGAIEPSLVIAETERALNKPTANLDAYDLCLRALDHYGRFTRADFEEAVRLLRRAIALDPDFALAKAMIAVCLGNMVDVFRWIPLGGPEVAEAVSLARAALVEARDDPAVLSLAGLVVARHGLDIETARIAVDRALALSPNSARTVSASAHVRFWCEDWAAARDQFLRAIRLSPFDPMMRYFLMGLGDVQIELGELEAALDPIRKVIAAGQGHDFGMRSLLHCLVLLGRMEEAREVARTMLRINPELTLTYERTRSSPFGLAYNQRRLASLRAAGIPE